MKISFHGAAETVTGSNHLIETENSKLLIDCGMFQGPKNITARNYNEFAYDPKEIDAVIITHAHIDHSGLLPKLIKQGFNGPIYTTHATKELLEILLYDSAHIQLFDLKWKNKKRARQGLPLREPLYTEHDVDRALSMIREIDYHARFKPVSNIVAKIYDAGHIMGSGFVTLDITENGITKKLIASGDLGRSHQAIIDNPEVIKEADLIMIESTYGDRIHKTLSNTNKELLTLLETVYRERGTLIIPAFTVGRTQELLYHLFELADEKKLPKVHIFIDSPMADKVTKIYEENKDLYDQKTLEYIKQGKNPLAQAEFHFTKSSNESKAINEAEGPKIIISASGMCNGGRIVHHLKHNIWKENTHILFVGYQAVGTLGRRIVEGAKTVTIMGDAYRVKSQIHTIGGLSAHADQNELIAWLRFYKKSDPKVFLIHGDPKALVAYSKIINEKLGFLNYTPKWHETAEIEFLEDSLKIEMKPPEIEADFSGEKNRWLAITKNINSIIEQYATKDLSYKEQGVVDELLNQLNKKAEDLVAEFKAELKK